jgi:hypothetical protein
MTSGMPEGALQLFIQSKLIVMQDNIYGSDGRATQK